MRYNPTKRGVWIDSTFPVTICGFLMMVRMSKWIERRSDMWTLIGESK